MKQMGLSAPGGNTDSSQEGSVNVLVEVSAKAISSDVFNVAEI